MDDLKIKSILEAGKTMIDFAQANYNIPIRILGSIALFEKCPNYIYLWEILNRKFPIDRATKEYIIDLDLIILYKDERKFIRMMNDCNFQTSGTSQLYSTMFNRLLYYPPEEGIFKNLNFSFPIEVFFQKLELHHDINLNSNLLSIDDYSISLTDLLLTKLQYDLSFKNGIRNQAQINQLIDLCVLIAQFPMDWNNEKESFSTKRIARTLYECKNIQLKVTVTRSINDLISFIKSSNMEQRLQEMIIKKVNYLHELINKSKRTKIYSLKEQYYSNRPKLGRELYNLNQY